MLTYLTHTGEISEIGITYKKANYNKGGRSVVVVLWYTSLVKHDYFLD